MSIMGGNLLFIISIKPTQLSLIIITVAIVLLEKE